MDKLLKKIYHSILEFPQELIVGLRKPGLFLIFDIMTVIILTLYVMTGESFF